MKLQKQKLSIRIFADGADLSVIKRLKETGVVKGFTTNPSLMRKAGVQDYKSFAKQVLKLAPELPLSLEVFSDNLEEMESQARIISSWGKNIFVKIPVMNTQRRFTGPILKSLSRDGVKLNVTAVMSVDQIKNILEYLTYETPVILSVFAGRIADTGRDPVPIMEQCVDLLQSYNNVELLWASTRELFNVMQASQLGCDIITVGEDILDKMGLIGKDLDDFSRETVEMFYKDALDSKFRI
ncbi:MAG: transaldolase [Rhodobacteraceae bacterium]|nr:MAG: transaldolase [Paracoccaceae bacterium]